MRRLALGATLCFLTVLGVPASGAPAATNAPHLAPPGSDLEWRPTPVAFRDSMIEDRGASLRAGGADSGQWRSFTLVDGRQVRIQVEPTYGPDADVAERYASLLGSLLHGDEISRLWMYVASPQGVSKICGPAEPACYFTDTEMMIVPAEQRDGDPMPLEMIIAHEYGHHIARNLDNKPWSASEWGPKRWMTEEGVCGAVHAGTAFPGDEGMHYWENPGEAFAQAYAFYHYPDTLPWWWSLGEPDQAAFDAIRADVETPWHGGTRTRRAAILSNATPSASFSEPTPLDGRLTARLDAPEDTEFDLVLLSSDGTVLERTTSAGSDDVLKAQICGTRSVTLEVRRESGEGRFHVNVRRP